MHSNTFEPNDDKPKALKNNKKNNKNSFFDQISIPVEDASCFDVTSPIADLIDRILNERISIKNSNKIIKKTLNSEKYR
jgi:predicted RNA methylase